MNRRQGILILVVLVVAVALPVAGNWLRGKPEDRCALDGAEIVPIYRVRIEDSHGTSREFCCVRCAELWLERQHSPPRSVFVTDEASGQEIPAESAFFVRSLVVTMPATGSRIHTFRNRDDATRHAEMCRGTLLKPNEWPFAVGQGPPTKGE